MKSIVLLFSALVWLTGFSFAQQTIPASPSVSLLIRCDDIGMNYAVNQATRQVLESGLPISTSVMFACPWYQQAVEILKRYPNVSVGVHLTLNSEWKYYRWGPVAGARTVPSLVDSVGYFFPTRAALFANNPNVEEVEIELRAQIDRALRSGLKIEYLDYHMGAAVTTLDLRMVVEKLAQEYGLAISRYFGEEDLPGVYFAPIQSKKDTLLAAVSRLQPGRVHLLVHHIGLDTPEMSALIDMNETGLPQMSKHRQAELDALLSKEFRELIQERGTRLITYRDLIREVGLKGMKRPALR